MQTSAHPAEAQLARRLGFWSSIAIVIGITIGSGIFRTPAIIAARVPDPTLMLAVWAIGGVISLCGALSIAELAAAFPHSGGFYVFLREGWGRPAAFLFGWAELVLIHGSAVAGISTVFSEYLMRSVGFIPDGRMTSYVAAVAIALAGAANIRGVNIGAALAGVSTIAKFGALMLMVVASFALGGATGASAANFSAAAGPVDAGLFGLALISVLWAYDGFADISFAGGEVAEPQRNLPRAIVAGTLAIIAIYMAVNAAYLFVNPVDRMAGSPLVAADTMQAIFGSIGGSMISVVVAISTCGGLVSTMLTSPRVLFAMADDGLLFRKIAAVHPRYHTPHTAIALSSILGIGFVLTRTFEQLADTFVLSVWPFYGLAIAGLYRLRVTRPDLPRPYRVPLYPVVPAIFIAAVIYLVGNALVTDPLWTAVTFGVVLAGMPVYYLTLKRPALTAIDND
jgi:APA family basic amino acid/polyamine antiporter